VVEILLTFWGGGNRALSATRPRLFDDSVFYFSAIGAHGSFGLSAFAVIASWQTFACPTRPRALSNLGTISCHISNPAPRAPSFLARQLRAPQEPSLNAASVINVYSRRAAGVSHNLCARTQDSEVAAALPFLLIRTTIQTAAGCLPFISGVLSHLCSSGAD
jgi:hypothetical protein